MLSAESICYYRSPCKEYCCYHAQDLSLSNGAYPASKCRDRDRCTAAGLDVTRRAPFHRTRAQIYRKLRRSIQISFRAVTCKPAVIRAPLHAEKAHTHDAFMIFCSVMHKDARNMTVSDPSARRLLKMSSRKKRLPCRYR